MGLVRVNDGDVDGAWSLADVGTTHIILCNQI